MSSSENDQDNDRTASPVLSEVEQNEMIALQEQILEMQQEPPPPQEQELDEGVVVMAEAIESPSSRSGDSSILSVKGRDFEKMRQRPMAVAQPFNVDEHYGHIVDMENGDMTVDSGDIPMRYPGGMGINVMSPRSMRNVVPSSPGDGLSEENMTDRQRNLFEVYRIGRFLRHMCLVNVVLVMISGLIIPVYLILLALPVCGYIGCRRYNARLLTIYLTYCILEMIGGLVSLFVLPSLGYIIIRLMYFGFNYSCARHAKQLASFCLAFEEGDLEFLHFDSAITEVERASLC